MAVMIEMLRQWLAHPLTQGLDLDDPKTTQLRRRIIAEKPYLHEIYSEWYRSIAGALPNMDGPVLELGSGAGFLSEFIPYLITSEIIQCNNVNLISDGQALPIAGDSLRAIVLTNVLHHLPSIPTFLNEAERCVKPGGAIVMIEPWRTSWSKWVYTKLHHEPFDDTTYDWEFSGSGPLSSSNGALPWVIFERDREKFSREYPEWIVEKVVPGHPFRYLLSGGVSMRPLIPGWSFGFWKILERSVEPWMNSLAMFALIILKKRRPG